MNNRGEQSAPGSPKTAPDSAFPASGFLTGARWRPWLAHIAWPCENPRCDFVVSWACRETVLLEHAIAIEVVLTLRGGGGLRTCLRSAPHWCSAAKFPLDV